MFDINRQQKIEINSEKNFGMVFGIFFALVFFYIFIIYNNIFYWLLLISFLFFLFSIIKPNIFKIPNKIWFIIGLTLGKIISPIIILILFFFVVTPFSFLVKIFKNNLLDKNFDKKIPTYWITRNSPINKMKDQF